MAVWAGVGVGLGLLVLAVLAVTSRRDVRGVRPAAAFGLTYLLLLLPILSPSGLTLVPWLLLSLLVGGAVAVAWFVGRREGRWRSHLPTARTLDTTSALVSVGLGAVLLVAAAESLSLVGRVHPVAVTVALGVVAVCVALAAGARGAARVAGWVVGVLAVVAVLLLAVGAYLGRPGDLVDPVTSVPGLPLLGVVAVVLAVPVLAAVDPALRGAVSRLTPSRLTWACVLAVAITVVAGVGLLLVFGGVVVAPSLTFFTVPANAAMIPSALVVTMAVTALWIATAVTALLVGGAAAAARMNRGVDDAAGLDWRWAVGLGAGAVVIAVLPVPSVVVFGATAVVAAVGLVATAALARR